METSNIIEVFADKRVKASIDKLQISGHSSTDILLDDFEELVSRCGGNRFLVEETNSNNPFGYKRLIEISYRRFYEHGKYEVCKIVIMIGSNAGDSCITYKAQRAFKIEFNPNKFDIPDWLLYYFIERKYKAEEVKNIDVAFDFEGISKNAFRYALNSGNTKVMSIGTQNNMTDVIGCADKSANRIKIYDKRKERERFYQMFGDVTRVEITLEWKYLGVCFNSTVGDLNSLNKASYALEQIFIADNLALDPFVYALSCLCPSELNTALSLMSLNTRKKYKRLLKVDSGYKLSCNTIILREFLLTELEKILNSVGMFF